MRLVVGCRAANPRGSLQAHCTQQHLIPAPGPLLSGWHCRCLPNFLKEKPGEVCWRGMSAIRQRPAEADQLNCSTVLFLGNGNEEGNGLCAAPHLEAQLLAGGLWALGTDLQQLCSMCPGMLWVRELCGNAGSCVRVLSSSRSLQSASALKETPPKNPNPP